jgi:Spy/CpxP family protein refolding chaperone
MLMAAWGITETVAAQGVSNPLAHLNLTEEQVTKLAELGREFNRKQFGIAVDITTKFTELELELKREDRFETEQKAKIAAEKVNTIVKEVSRLYGELLKTRVEYLLKAKDVLTRQQRATLIAGLDFEMDVPEDLTYYQEFDLVAVGLDLSREQIRKILRYRTDMKINKLRLELKIDYKVLDLEIELTQDEVDSEKVNRIIMDVTDLGTKLLDNRVEHFLKAKDVLTVTQKQKLLHLIMTTQ